MGLCSLCIPQAFWNGFREVVSGLGPAFAFWSDSCLALPSHSRAVTIQLLLYHLLERLGFKFRVKRVYSFFFRVYGVDDEVCGV